MTPKLSRDRNPSAQITKREREREGAGERERIPGAVSFSLSSAITLSLSRSLALSLSRSLALSLSRSLALSLSSRRRQRDFAFGVIVNVISDHPGRVRYALIAGEVVNVHHVRPAVAFDDVQAVKTKAANF